MAWRSCAARVVESPRWLRRGGALLLELGGDEADALRGDLERADFTDVHVLVDEDGDVRGVEATLSTRPRCPATATTTRVATMPYAIDWDSAEVEDQQLRVQVQPDPDFAFIEVFDTVLIESPEPPGAAGWGQVQFAGGGIVVSEVQPGSAPALQQFLDGVVRTADERVGAERDRLEREAERERAGR